jgi:hypothetical protein
MPPSLKELEALSDSQIGELYDKQASGNVGASFYLDELNRRATNKQTEAMLVYTRWITIMTVAILAATFVSTGVVIYATLFRAP